MRKCSIDEEDEEMLQELEITKCAVGEMSFHELEIFQPHLSGYSENPVRTTDIENNMPSSSRRTETQQNVELLSQKAT